MSSPPSVTTLSGRPAAASDAMTGIDALRVVSISHRTAPLEELERIALSPATLARLLHDLGEHGIEAVALSTCNRTELYTHAAGAADHERAFRLLLELADGAPPPPERFVTRTGAEAAGHLFRLAAGLESLVLGEAEVLGQVREAIEVAEAGGATGLFLPGLFRAALRFGGRARAETAISVGALSIASASVRLLARTHPDLAACTVLVVGAGASGLKAARHLKAERVARLLIANRTVARAVEAAAELGAEAIGLAEVPQQLDACDVVIAAAQTGRPLITVPMLEARADAERPLVLVDVSLPRAIDPQCANLPGVVLHDLSGLEQIVAVNRSRREGEIPRVLALLEHDLQLFMQQARESSARPLVAELRQRAETIRREEIERAARDGLTGGALLERVTQRIVDRLMHAPSAALRRGDLVLDEPHARYLRMIFGLDAAADPEAGGRDGGADDPS